MRKSVRSIRAACLLLVFFAHGYDAFARPDFAALEKSVVRIVTQTSQGTSTGSGFVINDHGHIATNVHVIDGADFIKAVPAYSHSLYDVDVIARSDELDLAILHVQEVGLPPIDVSGAELKKGQRVWSLGYPGRADRDNRPARDATVQEGVISRMFTGAWKTQPLGIIQHSAETNPGNSGGPLVDDCGRVVGVNTQASLFPSVSPSGEVQRVTLAAGIYWSSRIEELTKLLDAHNISYRSVNDPCTPAGGAGGSEEAERARQKAEEATRQAGEATRKAEEANRKTERTRQEAEDAKRRADEAARQAEEASREIEETRLQAEASRRLFLMGGILLGALTLASLLLVLKKPRQQIIHVAERMSRPIRRRGRDGAVRSRPEKKRPASGLVLAGFDGGGNRIRVALSPEKFHGKRLGISLGRHSDLVDEVIHYENISRRHVRITSNENGFHIEDLNSSNGTLLNHRRLTPFRPERLDDGATVTLGDLEVKVSRY